LDWNLWLGTAPTRPFLNFWPQDKQSAWAKNVYHPRSWRGWVDFGTGALGDMACHTVNWPFRSLKLGYPTEIEASSSGMKPEMYPTRSSIRFEFPAREALPPVTFHWADGGNKPPAGVTEVVAANFGRVSDSGCIMIGDKGVIFSPDDGDDELRAFVKLKGEEGMLGLDNHPAAKAIPQSIPRNAFTGPVDFRQHREWIQACKDGKMDAPYSRFDIAANLTEIMLLGCVALRAGKKLEWDGPGMTVKNAPEAARFVKREYRAGWSL
jgi:predicted dehydrogenase